MPIPSIGAVACASRRAARSSMPNRFKWPNIPAPSTSRVCSGTWIVLDGIDQLLRRQPNGQQAIDQIARLNDWSIQHDYSLLLTGKHVGDHRSQPDHLTGIEFMLSTILVLSSTLVDKRLDRRFRITKYRGNPAPPRRLWGRPSSRRPPGAANAPCWSASTSSHASSCATSPPWASSCSRTSTAAC